MTMERVRSVKAGDKASLNADVVRFLEIVLKRILQEEEKVKVAVKEMEKTTVFEVDIGESDYGRLLGSRGKNITSLRALVLSMGASYGYRAIIEIKNEDRFY